MSEHSRRVADRWEWFSASRLGLAIMFAWAFAEANVWPVIPDALLAPMIIGAHRSFLRLLAATVVGSALGGVVLYGYAFAEPAAALAALPGLPMVSDRTIERADHLLAGRGQEAFVMQPVSGVPFKVVAVIAAARSMDPLQVLPVSITARTLRIGLIGVLAALLASRFRSFFRDRFLILAGLYLLIFGYAWWLTQR